MTNVKKEAQLKLPCLGRSFQLGSLYNFNTDEFITREAIWNMDDGNTKTEECESNDYKVVTDESFDQKATYLEMDPSTKLSFLSGRISVEGSAKYLEDAKSSNKQARVVLKYSCNTLLEKVRVGKMRLKNFQCRDIVDDGHYTHVVTAVQYGFDAVFVFDRSLLPGEDCKAVEGASADAIRKILKFYREGRGPLMMTEHEEKELNKFHCTYHGDGSILKNPTTISEAMDVFQSLPKLLDKLKQEGKYGVPKKAYLSHLNEFGFNLPRKLQTGTSDLAFVIQTFMESFSRLQIDSSDLIMEESCCRYPGIKQQITKFKQMMSDFVKQTQENFADALPEIREGKIEQSEATEYIKSLKQTPFEESKLAFWLEAKKQESDAIKQSLLPLENCTFVHQEKELEQFLHERNKKYVVTLSFGIIASNTHPYLEEMSGYLSNADDISDSDESFKEHWIYSDNMRTSFCKQVDLFAQFSSINKENVQLKCLVMVNYGRKAALHSPGEIFLYVDGCKKSFQPPSPPRAIELIKNAEHEVQIKWEAPKNMSQNIQHYCIEYALDCEDELENWHRVLSESNETYYRITQLQPDASYVFRVAAVCEAGRSAFSVPSSPFATKALPSPAARLLQDCTLLSPPSEGVPAWYLVPLTQTYHDTLMRLRKCEVGRGGSNKHTTKVLLIVGASGSGKTTLINGMINYLLRTKLNDEYRLKLIDEALQESQAHSQTQYITAYTIPWQEGLRIAHNLIIIDTPGYGDTRGISQDDQVTKQIKQFFDMKGDAAIDHLDAVGFVAQASAARLTDTQKYVFDAILSMFGRDIADNIFMMLTFADSRPPPALDAINAHKLPYKSYFKFNNSVFTQVSPQTYRAANDPRHAGSRSNEKFDELYWKLAEESFLKFFSDFACVEARSLKLTKEVLKERQILEFTIESVQQSFQAGIRHLTSMRQELLVVEQFEAEKTANKDFTRMVQIPKTRRIHFDEPGRYVTNCLNCNVTCHLTCQIPDDTEKFYCWAMDNPGDENTTCRICTSHCDWRKHVNRDHYFEEYMENETVTMEDLKKKYEYADESLSGKDNLIVGMYKQYNKVQIQVLKDMETVRKCLQRLDEIAMKRNPMTIVDYIDVLIRSTKIEGKAGWEERLDQLYAARERALMIQKMEKEGKQYDPFQEFKDEIEKAASMCSGSKRSLTKKLKSFFGFKSGLPFTFSTLNLSSNA